MLQEEKRGMFQVNYDINLFYEGYWHKKLHCITHSNQGATKLRGHKLN